MSDKTYYSLLILYITLGSIPLLSVCLLRLYETHKRKKNRNALIKERERTRIPPEFIQYDHLGSPMRCEGCGTIKTKGMSVCMCNIHAVVPCEDCINGRCGK